MPTKGQKTLRGQPEKWDELKKRVSVSLTPTGIDGLDNLAARMGMSRSDLLERIGRGIIPLHPDINEHTVTGKSDLTIEASGTL